MAAFGGGALQRFELHIRRGSHLTQGIETLRNHVEDAGIVQIVPQGFVEGLQQVGVLRILAGGLEIGNGQTNFLHAQPGAGLDPVLGKAGGQQKQR